MNSISALLNPSVGLSISTFSPPTPGNETHCDYHPSVKTWFTVLHFAIIILGLPSNGFAAFVSYQHVRQGNELGVYLLNLALTDICFILMLPVWMEYNFASKWKHGDTACVVSVFFLFTQFYYSVCLLCCIAVDRYLAVVHPLRFPAMRKMTTAVGMCILSWTFTVVFNAATLSKETVYRYDHEASTCLDVFPMKLEYARRVSYARFLTWFLLPSLLVGFCSWQIRREVQSNRATEKQERNRVCRLLLLVQLTVAVCFGPLHIMFLVRALWETCQTLPWISYPYKAGAALATLNCLADPLLYCFITRSGKANIRKAIVLLQRKNTNSMDSGALELELNRQFQKPK
ncbi:G-protein coupled receptor 4-like [Engraulis encrasicolus]|uniref:G-protein coupled receptor 4-like n=1 Tax=Engraulis encrasicolus TaxID=184585 RepID=UPI002FD1D8F1